MSEPTIFLRYFRNPYKMVYSIWIYVEVYLSNISEENARIPYKHRYKTFCKFNHL